MIMSLVKVNKYQLTDLACYLNYFNTYRKPMPRFKFEPVLGAR